MIIARKQHRAVQLNGEIYAIGGVQKYEHLKTVEQYEIGTNRWFQTVEMNEKRFLIFIP